MNNLSAIVQFIREHGLSTLSICGWVHFECVDGIQHKVRSLAEAKEILRY